MDVDPAMLGRARTAWARARQRRGSRRPAHARGRRPPDGRPRSPVRGRAHRRSTASSCSRRASVRPPRWRRSARHLRPAGLAVVDVWLPRPRRPGALRRAPGARVAARRSRDRRAHRQAPRRSPRQRHGRGGADRLVRRLAAGRRPGAPRSRRTDRLRLVRRRRAAWPWPRRPGSTVESIEGDHAGSPFGPGAERAVLLARLV